MEYKFYFSDTEPFWDNNSENRPSLEYLDSINWYPLNKAPQLNYINAFSASVNINNDLDLSGYHLFKIEAYSGGIHISGRDKYYYIDNVSNENSETITYILTLDIWLTYSKNLFIWNSWVETIRNMHRDISMITYNDELLDGVPISFKDGKLTPYKMLYDTNNRSYYTKASNINSYVYDIYFGGATSLNTNTYYVFKNIPNGKLKNAHYVFPVLLYNDFGRVDRYQLPGPVVSMRYYNNPSTLDNLIIKNEYSANFIGKFILPAAIQLELYDLIDNDGTPLLGFIGDFSDHLYAPQTTWNFRNIFLKLPDTLTASYEYNSLNINSPAVFKYYKINIMNLMNTQSWLYYLNENMEIAPKAGLNWTYIYSGGGGIILSNTGYSTNQENILSLPYALPSSSDEYSRYYSSVKNQINTGIQQANDKALMSGAQSIINGLISGASGAASGIISGNPAAAFGAIAGAGSNIAFGVGNSVIGNMHYKQNVNAKLGDVKAISGNVSNPSTTTDTAWLLGNFSSYPNTHPGEYSFYIQPNDNSLIRLNNIIYLYGNCNPKNDYINNFINYQEFNYILLSENWIGVNIDILFKSCSKAELAAIKSNISGGLRIWNNYPNVGIENVKK